KLGADGIVPSVGNLIPETCHQLCVAAEKSDWSEAEQLYARMNSVAAVYQKGRTLNESLAALKAAVSCRGLCAPGVLPPLHALPQMEVDKIRGQMGQLHLFGWTIKPRPVLGLTMGDPAGIGPEICLRALHEPSVRKQCIPVLFGDAGILQRLSHGRNGSSHIETISLADWKNLKRVTEPLIVDCQAVDARPVRPGKISPACGRAGYI